MKRKRYIFYDGTEMDLKKRRKIAESLEKIPFIEEFPQKLNVYDTEDAKFKQIARDKIDTGFHYILPKKYDVVEVLKSYILPTTPEKKKKVGFSSINRDSDVKKVFGVEEEFLPDWKYEFPQEFKGLEELSKKLQKTYENKLLVWVGKKEQDDRVYISDIVDGCVQFVRGVLKKKIIVLNEAVYEGEDAIGPIDYVIKCEGVVLVVVEAKKTGEYERGVPQLLMQLKAVQESEGMQNKWYYGFAATKDLWTPCRLNMKTNDKVQIGQRLKIEERAIVTFSQVVYVMKSMMLREFD